MCVCLSSFIPDEGVFTGATSDSLMARFHLNNLPFVPSFLLLKILYILMRSLHDFLPALPLTSWPVHELCSYEKRPGLCLPNVFLFFFISRHAESSRVRSEPVVWTRPAASVPALCLVSSSECLRNSSKLIKCLKVSSDFSPTAGS